MLMFGYCNELCGEHGYGWAKRLMLLNPILTNADAEESARAFASHLGNKYGYERAEAEGGAGSGSRDSENPQHPLGATAQKWQ